MEPRSDALSCRKIRVEYAKLCRQIPPPKVTPVGSTAQQRHDDHGAVHVSYTQMLPIITRDGDIGSA